VRRGLACPFHLHGEPSRSCVDSLTRLQMVLEESVCSSCAVLKERWEMTGVA
jgi:hypothetical protein